MNITNLIAQLEKAREQYGDLNVLRRHTNPRDGSINWHPVGTVSYGKRTPIETVVGDESAEWVSIE